jgi:hypothetical protein
MAITVTTNEPRLTPAPVQAEEAQKAEVEKSASAVEETLAHDETLDVSDASDDSQASMEAEHEESAHEDGKPKKKGGFQRRIERLNKQKSEALRELEYWKAEALKSQKPQEDQPKQEAKKEAVSDGKPTAENFETHEAYVEALADWKYDQRKKADEIREKQVQVKTEFQKTVESFQSKVKEFQKTQKDFEEVLSDVDDIRMSIGVQEVLLSSDLGPQVMYELAKDRELYERINALNPLAAARELGRIEARISEKTESSNETKKQTKAPTPIKPVGGMNAGSLKKSIFDPNISQSEYERLRREQETRRA